ncbi:MAG: type II secretion system major pseudopilin GspG [Nibricoccus sp.]
MYLKSYPAHSRGLAGKAVRAFTVLEMMIVIAIIGMLVGLLLKNIGGANESAKLSMAEIFVKSSVKLPLQTYSMQMGDYPSTAEGLQALVVAPSAKADRWRGPYFEDGKLPLDPWGESYQYRYPATKKKGGYDVWSKGPDKQDGTEDDIGNW